MKTTHTTRYAHPNTGSLTEQELLRDATVTITVPVQVIVSVAAYNKLYGCETTPERLAEDVRDIVKNSLQRVLVPEPYLVVVR